MRQVFVYGSLKRGGFLNHQLTMHGAEFLRDAGVEGYSLWSVMGMYPAMLPQRGGVTRGEVWAVPDEALEIIDLIEAQYVRVPIKDMEGEEVEAYVWRADSGYSYLTFHGAYWEARVRPSYVYLVNKEGEDAETAAE